MSTTNLSIEPFLKGNCSLEKPLLLALSGGADSMALLYLLYPFQNKAFTKLHIAHVDHGWRKESEKEAETLEKIAKEKGLPFHCKKLNKSEMAGNLENSCREARLTFFREVVDQIGAQGVMVGHQADDQVETVIKRLFEGGHLSRCAGIEHITAIEGLTIFRPLLNLKKEELIHFLEERKIPYFRDPTNEDPTYLRSRMRMQLIPTLEEQFGKRVISSLLHFSKEVQRLNRYFDEKLAYFLQQKLVGPFGTCYNWEENHPEELVEWEELFCRSCEEERFTCSQPQREWAAHHLLEGGAEKRIEWMGRSLLIDRRRLFFLKETKPDWKMRIGGGGHANVTGWKEAFLGKVSVTLPKGHYEMAKAPREGRFRHLLSNHKVPHCLWEGVPVLLAEGELVHEFLTGLVKHQAPVTEGVTIELYNF